jgi:hypothetical protein
VCEELGLPKITWHSLRHCHATLLDAVGAPLGTVQALLGHASSEVTRQIYLHAIPAEQRRAVEGVEKLLIGPKLLESCKNQISNRLICGQMDGGRDRDRTGDPCLQSTTVLSNSSLLSLGFQCFQQFGQSVFSLPRNSDVFKLQGRR